MQILFNNEPCKTDAKTSAEFLNARSNSENDVWIVNGFCTRDAIVLKDGDELFCIPRGIMPPFEALEAMMSSRHTPKVHNKLKNPAWLFVGLVGLAQISL